MKQLTPSQEHYLEVIYNITSAGKQKAQISEIARKSDVRLSSVTRAIDRLAQAGFVLHRSYGAVRFTEKGLKAAKSVIRRDEILTILLVDILKIDKEIAKKEVCRLEHVVSNEVLQRLKALVDYATNPESSTWLVKLEAKLSKGFEDTEAGSTNLHSQKKETK